MTYLCRPQYLKVIIKLPKNKKILDNQKTKNFFVELVTKQYQKLEKKSSELHKKYCELYGKNYSYEGTHKDIQRDTFRTIIFPIIITEQTMTKEQVFSYLRCIRYAYNEEAGKNFQRGDKFEDATSISVLDPIGVYEKNNIPPNILDKDDMDFVFTMNITEEKLEALIKSSIKNQSNIYKKENYDK